MKGLLILDVAHGQNIANKQSPDGKFHEWKWSREICNKIISFGTDLIEHDIVCPFLNSTNEPGLIRRVNAYNKLTADYDYSLVCSMHNNRATLEDKWWKGTTHGGRGGFEIWTDEEFNLSDRAAAHFFKHLKGFYPEQKFRDLSPEFPAKNKNFTVIHGYRSGGVFIPRQYEAFLLENMFMDNSVDIYDLLNPDWNKRHAQYITICLDEIMKYLKNEISRKYHAERDW